MSGRRMVRWGVLRAWATCGSVRTRLPRNAGTRIPTLRLLRHRIRLWMIRLPATIVAGTEARPESRKKRPAAVLADKISNSDQQYHTTDRHTNTDGNALSMRQVVIRAVEVVITVIHGDQETPKCPLARQAPLAAHVPVPTPAYSCPKALTMKDYLHNGKLKDTPNAKTQMDDTDGTFMKVAPHTAPDLDTRTFSYSQTITCSPCRF